VRSAALRQDLFALTGPTDHADARCLSWGWHCSVSLAHPPSDGSSINQGGWEKTQKGSGSDGIAYSREKISRTEKNMMVVAKETEEVPQAKRTWILWDETHYSTELLWCLGLFLFVSWFFYFTYFCDARDCVRRRCSAEPDAVYEFMGGAGGLHSGEEAKEKLEMTPS